MAWKDAKLRLKSLAHEAVDALSNGLHSSDESSGNYIGTEGTGGDPLDGRFSFSVVGNQKHDIRVYDGQFNYPKTMYFSRGSKR